MFTTAEAAETTSYLHQSLATDLEQMRHLLQKGLTIYEMEQEIARLTQKEAEISEQIVTLSEEIKNQEKLVAITKDQAGKVLRSYYLGERDSLWLLLLSLDSLTEAIAAFEFISTIIGSDQKRINDYADAQQQLQQLLELSLVIQTDLQRVKQQFIDQRDAQLALQRELDSELATRSDADEVLQQIEQLTTDWQTEGLPIFRQYLQAFAEAMEQLVDIQAMYSNVITLRGANILFTITDEQLNEFLKSKDPILENLTFRFLDGQVEAGGQHEHIGMKIVGQFQLELEPDNVIRFKIDELLYNDFVLPETTALDLQEQFAFSFYPEHVSFLGLSFKATELTTASGVLTVKLEI